MSIVIDGCVPDAAHLSRTTKVPLIRLSRLGEEIKVPLISPTLTLRVFRYLYRSVSDLTNTASPGQYLSKSVPICGLTQENYEALPTSV